VCANEGLEKYGQEDTTKVAVLNVSVEVSEYGSATRVGWSSNGGLYQLAMRRDRSPFSHSMFFSLEKTIEAKGHLDENEHGYYRL